MFLVVYLFGSNDNHIENHYAVPELPLGIQEALNSLEGRLPIEK